MRKKNENCSDYKIAASIQVKRAPISKIKNIS